MSTKAALAVGDRVQYTRTHDGHTKMTGTVRKIHDGHDVVEIDRDVDGKIAEIEGVDHAAARDVVVLEKARPKAAPAKT